MIPTAEELITAHDDAFYKENHYYLSKTEPEEFAKQIAIQFAKLHVEAALKEASEQASAFTSFDDKPLVSKLSILNSYPLADIK